MTRPDPPASPEQTSLRRAITGPLLFAFILGDVLGAGIYALMGVLSEKVGGMLWAPLILALLLALLTAGSYAELVTKYPRAGGAAVFAERAFRRPLVSFLIGFCMLAAGVTSAAGLAIAFAGDYLGTFLDLPTIPVAIVFLAIVAALNARGIRESLRETTRIVAAQEGQTIATVVTAKPLPATQAERLQAALAAKYGDLKLNQVVDPTIIGGLRVQIGDDVIDGTVASRLTELRLQLAG